MEIQDQVEQRVLPEQPVEVVLKGYPELAATRDHQVSQGLRELRVLREPQVRVDYRVEVEDKGHPELVATRDLQELPVRLEQRAGQEAKVCPV